MKIKFISTARFNDKIQYTFEDQKITAKLGDKIDEVDFSEMPDGELEGLEESNLPSTWLKKARKVNGEVQAVLYQDVQGHAQRRTEWFDPTEGYKEPQKLNAPDKTEYPSNYFEELDNAKA